MKAEITVKELYYNPAVKDFFFRAQAYDTLAELLDRAGDHQTTLDTIDEFAEIQNYDLDELEELFYSEEVEDIADLIGIELEEEEE